MVCCFGETVFLNARSNSFSSLVTPAFFAASLKRLICSSGVSSGSFFFGMRGSYLICGVPATNLVVEFTNLQLKIDMNASIPPWRVDLQGNRLSRAGGVDCLDWLLPLAATPRSHKPIQLPSLLIRVSPDELFDR